MESAVLYLLLPIVVVALAVAIYIGTGGRAWFGATEHPERLLARTVQLKDCEWLGAVSLPSATVSSYEAPVYRLDFTVPVEVEGRLESFVRVHARHAGYPLSGAERRATWAVATLESGRGFIARLEVCKRTVSEIDMERAKALLKQLRDMLREGGEHRYAEQIETALTRDEDAICSFLTSNELWGGAGSITDEGLDSSKKARRALEQLLVKLGREQIALGRTNPRTLMWTSAFEQWHA